MIGLINGGFCKMREMKHNLLSTLLHYQVMHLREQEDFKEKMKQHLTIMSTKT